MARSLPTRASTLTTASSSSPQVATDDYTSEPRLSGRNRLLLTNLCEDSLLASPRLVDPAILGDLMTRIQYVAPSDKPPDGAEAEGDRESMYSVLSPLSYSLKASLCKPKTDVVNSLSRQRAAVTNMLRALIGLSLDSDLLLQTRVW